MAPRLKYTATVTTPSLPPSKPRVKNSPKVCKLTARDPTGTAVQAHSVMAEAMRAQRVIFFIFIASPPFPNTIPFSAKKVNAFGSQKFSEYLCITQKILHKTRLFQSQSFGIYIKITISGNKRVFSVLPSPYSIYQNFPKNPTLQDSNLPF
jgi:hypothetical protein